MNTPERLSAIPRYLAQAVIYVGFMALLATFTAWPGYRQLPENTATIKLSVRHSGKIVGVCRDLSAAELAKLPANMRAPKVCPRERSPLHLQLVVNGVPIVDEQVAAKGLHSDGMAAFYRRVTIPSGVLTLEVRMKDDVMSEAFPYHAQFHGNVAAARVMVIDFDAKSGKFVIL